MSILNKKVNDNISGFCLITSMVVLGISFFAMIITPTITGKSLAKDTSSEINYFVSGDKVHLEKQKTENKQSPLFNRNIKISYPDEKTINIFYSTTKLNNSDIKITTRTLYRLDSDINSKIKEINLDGVNIPVNTFELNKNNQEKVLENINKTENLSENHVLTIKLK